MLFCCCKLYCKAQNSSLKFFFSNSCLTERLARDLGQTDQAQDKTQRNLDTFLYELIVGFVLKVNARKTLSTISLGLVSSMILETNMQTKTRESLSIDFCDLVGGLVLWTNVQTKTPSTNNEFQCLLSLFNCLSNCY